MRKLLLISFSIGLFCLYASAQVADTAFATVVYSFTHVIDTTQPENPVTYNMGLFLGKSMSEYTNYARVKMEQVRKTQPSAGSSQNIVTANGNVMTAITTNNNPVSQITVSNSYFKNMDASKMFFIVYNGGKLFSVEEQTPVIDWTITQESKELQGFTCQKATCFFKGRYYEAWFCSQLPYSNGPWKLGGLPGLILEAYDTKKEVVFKFVSFENASGEPMVIEMPSTALKTNLQEYKQYDEALKRDSRANIGGASVGGGIVVHGSYSGVGATGKPVKPIEMNNPIEKGN